MPRALADCRRCRRLQHQFNRLRVQYPDYWNRPVGAIGDPMSPLLIVGLAPGLHGANRTGQPFTGDASGDLLFSTLTELEIAGRVQITNAVKCLPVSNKPAGREVDNCQGYLRAELAQLAGRPDATVLALGRIAHNAVLKALGKPQNGCRFAHGAQHEPGQGIALVDSYHCSRYNTQTGRLTPVMFQQAVRRAAVCAGLVLSGSDAGGLQAGSGANG
ncbi:MAG: uracil-DNA glycosylase [Proteobacteria bacterium]|jgi:uracil-DNA glycosylase family 4|nr:uracil-DNA glycosylase [Pseudomonadota bacterium]MDA1300654.1 uracil-DNA glycosylase [Pseudomonadota bacterium]